MTFIVRHLGRSVFLMIVFAASLASAVAQEAKKTEVASERVLRVGDTGLEVEGLQRQLNARLTPSPQLDVDGDFGEATKAAVTRFQKSVGLNQTGAADAATRKALGPVPSGDAAIPPPEVVNATPFPKQPADSLNGPPFTTSPTWVIADGKSGEALWGRSENKPVEMASTTKIMTALVVLRMAQKDPKVLDEVVTFSERADRTPGSTSGVKAGEKVSVSELLYGLLLPSGNDAAEAFAEHFNARCEPGPSTPTKSAAPAPQVAQFIGEMNRLAAQLGLQETHFVNPHGLPASGHQASCRDLARLAAEGMKDPLFARVVATPKRGATLVDATGQKRNVIWTNTNKLLETEGYTGVKTGTTSGAGACLVASGSRGDDRLIVVVLGAQSSDARYSDTRNLFRWAWQQRLPKNKTQE